MEMKRIIVALGLTFLCLIIFNNDAEAIQVFEKGSSGSVERPQFSIVSSTSRGIELDIRVPALETEEITEEGELYHKLHIPGCGYLDDLGAPMLPAVSTYLEIPDHVEVSIEELTSDSEILDGYNIYPAQEHLPDTGNITYSFNKDPQAYSKDEFYPKAICSMRKPFILRGHKVLMVTIYPVQFNPLARQIKVYDNIKVRVNFTHARQAKSLSSKTKKLQKYEARAARGPFRTMFKSFVLNYQPPATEPRALRSPDTGADYLIITPDEFYNTIVALADHKQQKGLIVRIVRTSEIPRTTGIAGNPLAASDMIQYIQSAYDNWTPAPTYVLLVGDTNLIPIHRGIQAPTDLYYATVDGDDYFPDIFLGRLPVRTINELSIVVDKIIDYEISLMSDPDALWRNRILLAAQKSRYFVTTSEANREFLESIGYDCTTVYTGGGYSGTTQDVIDAINAGCFIVNHRNHGEWDGWGHPRFTISDIPSLANTGGQLPVMFSINCLTGRFDKEATDCFGEALLKAHNGTDNTGVVAFIGATRISLSGYNDELDKGFFACMYPEYYPGYTNQAGNSDKMGVILNFGKFFMYDKYVLGWDELTYPRSWVPTTAMTEREFELFNLLGDPEMSILVCASNYPPLIYIRATTPTEVSGNGNGLIDPGENINLTIALIAINLDANTVSATLRCEDEFVTIINENSAFGAMHNYQTKDNSDDPFILSVSPNCPWGHEVQFILDIEEEGGYSVSRELSLAINSPSIAMVEPLILNDIVGNDDGFIDPGETIELKVELQAQKFDANNVLATLICEDDFVTMVNGESAFGSIPDGQTADNSTSPYVFSVSPDCPLGRELHFTINVVAANYSTAGGIALRVHKPWPQETGLKVRSSPAIADIGPDLIEGIDDMEIVVGSHDGKIYAWHYNGALVDGWPKECSSESRIRSSPVIADIDGDKDDVEIIVASESGRVYAWHGNGTRVSGWPRSVYTDSTIKIYSSPAIVDIGPDLGDKDDKEIVVSSTYGMVYIWHHNGTLIPWWLGWGQRKVVENSTLLTSSPAIADIGPDLGEEDDVEIVLGSDNGKVYAWHHNGTPVDGWPKETGERVCSSPTIGDIEDDG